MELTLKDQSVIEIGKSVGDNVNSLAGGASTALVPAGGGGAVAPAGGIATAMNPFDSMMVVLSDIRDGIYSLVDKFSESVSIQKDAKSDAALAQDLAQVADAGEGASDEGADPAPKQSFFQKAKDKVKGLMGMGGFKGLLVKGGLIFGLLGIAKLMQKYGKEIAEKVAPIVDGVKAFFSAFTDDIGPIFDSAVETVKTALTGIIDIVKGLFTGDASTFFGGVKKLFIDFPIQLVSYIGDAFFSLLENALAAFGIESEMVTDIKNFFRELPEKISQLFKDIGEFFTVTIPTKLKEIKDSITNFFNDNIVTPIKNLWTDIGNFFTITVPEKYNEITGNVTQFFTNIVTSISGFFTDAKNFVMVTIPEKIGEITKGITDKFTEIKDKIIGYAMAPFEKIKELMMGMVIGVLEAVEGLPFIGDKAKKMKEQIIAGQKIQEGATLEEATAGLSTFQTAEQQAAAIGTVNTLPDGSVINPEDGEMLKIRDEDTANTMAAELSKSGQGQFQAVYDDGGFFGRKFYKIVKTGEAVAGTGGGTTGGATGGELNGAGAEFVANGSGSGTGGNVNIMNEGAKVNTVSSNQTHMSEDTGTNDKNARLDLYDLG